MAVKIRKGGEWVEVSSVGGGGATVTTSDSAPGSPSDGDLWWNSTTGLLNVYYEDANSSQWVNATGRGGGSSSSTGGTTKVAVLEDQKTSGTAGGNFDTGAWRDRTLNTETDPESFVTLDSGNVYFSLPAGTYEIGWSAPATAVDAHQTRLIYATDTGFSSGVGYAYGSSEQSDQNEGDGGASTIINDNRSFGNTIITTSAITYFKIQHRCSISSSGSNGNTQDWGMGRPSSFSGDSQVEVYTQVSIEDLATGILKSTSTGTTKVATVKDVKAYNVDGGAASTNTWITRDLNTISDPYTIGLSVSANVITVPAGTYSIRWSAPAWRVQMFTSKVEYSTNSTFATGVTSVQGSNSFASNSSSDGTQSQTVTIGTLASVTFSTTTYVRIRQWNAQAKDPAEGDTDNALGVATNVSGAGDSVYTTVVIEDLATAVKEATSSSNVWHVQKTTNQTIDSETWTDITGLSQTVSSPTASTKFLIIATVNASMSNNSGFDGLLRLMRDATVIGSTSTEGSSNANQTGFAQISGQDSYYTIDNGGITFLDTPGVGSHTYHIEGLNTDNSSNLIINGRTAGSFFMVSHMSIQQYS